MTFARGAVVEILQRSEVIVSCGIGTDGLGAAVDPETLFAVYCSAKPVVALAVGMLVEAGELTWDDRLADVIDESEPGLAPRVREVTVAQLLTPTAGLHRLSAQAMFRRSPRDRRMMNSESLWTEQPDGSGLVAPPSSFTCMERWEDGTGDLEDYAITISSTERSELNGHYK